jgi:TnpA family transposase
VNFFLLFFAGYQFAPRYRDLHKKMASLVGFQHPNHYAHYLIKPSRKTFDALIVKEWPNIQRILASLAQKDVTQATVVRKLSSYARQNQTKKGLWELDNILSESSDLPRCAIAASGKTTSGCARPSRW